MKEKLHGHNLVVNDQTNKQRMRTEKIKEKRQIHSRKQLGYPRKQNR